jgi:hypothetical protein
MSNFFTYKGLEEFLKYLKKKRKITSFNRYQKKNEVILRHDVDLSIEFAYKLAEIEKKLNIFSSFFIMVSTNSYNPLTKQNRQWIKEMSDWGFEIGLHFDPTIYSQDENSLLDALRCESQILSSITSKKIETFSLHNPSVSKCFNLPTKLMTNTYSPEIFKPDYYISDSQMSFKKDIYKFIDETQNHQVQILLHPLHYHNQKKDYADIYSEVFTHLIEITDHDFQVNSTYKKEVNPDLLNCFVRKNSNSCNQRKKESLKSKD